MRERRDHVQVACFGNLLLVRSAVVSDVDGTVLRRICWTRLARASRWCAGWHDALKRSHLRCAHVPLAREQAPPAAAVPKQDGADHGDVDDEVGGGEESHYLAVHTIIGAPTAGVPTAALRRLLLQSRDGIVKKEGGHEGQSDHGDGRRGDVDGSGVIEYDELKNALSDKSEFGIEAVIAHAKSVTKPKPHMRLFGRLPQGFDPVPVEALIAKRARARLRMHYSEADRLQRRIERLGVKLDDRRRTWSVIKGWKKMQEELELEEEQSRRLKQQQEQQQQQQQQQHADAEPLHVYSLLLDDQGA